MSFRDNHAGVRVGYFLSGEEPLARPPSSSTWPARAEAGRLLGRALDQRPLPPLERRAGAEPVRVVVCFGVHRRTDVRAGRHDRGDVPHRPDPTPSIIAQASATSTATLMPWARFALGVGSGEALNEHTWGDRWPDWGTRGWRCWRRPSRSSGSCGRAISSLIVAEHYEVDHARIYTLPEETPRDLHVRVRPKRDRRRRPDRPTGSSSTKPEADELSPASRRSPSGKPAQGRV